MQEEEHAQPMLPEQQDLFEFLLFHTWEQTMKEFDIKSKSVLRTAIIRTALGLPWYKGHKGGPHPYLNFDKEAKLLHFIEESSESHQCLSTAEVASLALMLRQEAIREARASLCQRRCLHLAAALDPEMLPPSSSWLSRFAQRHQLHSVVARELESARHFGCERSLILQYFLKFLPFFNRDPRLIFGADETDMKPGQRFKVVCPQEAEGFTRSDEEVPGHITAMCCHSAGGVAVPPLLLLSKLRQLPSELRLPELCSPNICWFASTERGYMTEGSFYLWALLFTTWLSGYRATCLPKELQQEEILLLMDGCTSHHCPEALDLLRQHRVTVVILPAHTSHLLQAFDVLIAGALKAYFRRFVAEEKKHISGKTLGKAAKARLVLVAGFLRAWSAAASPAMCSKSFEVVGVFAPCPTRVLQSPFVTDTGTPQTRENLVSNSIVTDPATIQRLKANLKRAPMPELGDAWTPNDYDSMLSYFKNQEPKQGRLLSEPPALYMRRDDDWFVCRSHVPGSLQTAHSAVIMRTMHMLTCEMTQKGNEILQMFAEQRAHERQNVEREVVREAARNFAQEIATTIAVDRLRSLEHLAAQELQPLLLERVHCALADTSVDAEVRDAVARGITDCVNQTFANLCAVIADAGVTVE